MIVLHPSLQRALVAYGAGAILAGIVTHAMSLGDAWSLLGSGGGAFIAAGAVGLVRRTFAMSARSPEELEFRRLVLGIAALAAVLGSALFMLSLARCQGRRETRPKGGAKHCHRDRGGEVVRGGRDSA